MDGGALHGAWPSTIPELVTPRLRRRAPLPSDAAALLTVLGDPEATRYHNVPTLTTLTEAQALLERLGQRYAARDTIRWVIELVEQQEAIGTVGLLRFNFVGSRPKRRRLKHALKNAMIPVVTVVGLQLGILLGGTVVVEEVFTLPGVGRLVLWSIYQRDYPVTQSTILFVAALFMALNLAVDLLYGYLEPRIRYGD